jgi:protein-S-isoprenylcysteine O-methyltransferase Ste14
MIEHVGWGVLLVSWILWILAFIQPRKQAHGQSKSERAPSSRWGIALVTIAYAIVWTFVRPRGYHQPEIQSLISMIVGPASVLLAWKGAHRLGKQWRFEAALNENHELIQTGVYSWLRHPIYASMLGMFIATGLAWSWWPKTLIGLAVFIIGTEIRIRAEERLLSRRFPDYEQYRTHTFAYIPFIR